MNKIVREHYPVDRLPEDLRNHVPGAVSVRITIEAEGRAASRPISEILDEVRRLRAEGKIALLTVDEAVAQVRELRDEWDD